MDTRKMTRLGPLHSLMGRLVVRFLTSTYCFAMGATYGLSIRRRIIRPCDSLLSRPMFCMCLKAATKAFPRRELTAPMSA